MGRISSHCFLDLLGDVTCPGKVIPDAQELKVADPLHLRLTDFQRSVQFAVLPHTHHHLLGLISAER